MKDAANPFVRREPFLEKPLPSNDDAERVILGAILLDNNAIGQAAEVLKPEDFYSPLNRRVYAAMITLFAKGKQIDPVLVGEVLKTEGSLEAIGGTTTITNLTFGLPLFTDIDEYIRIVREKRMTRDIIRACQKITMDALSEEVEFEELANSAESQMFAVCETPYQAKVERLVELVDRSLTKTAELMKSGVEVVGVPSGLKDLDEMTGGWHRGELIILAARPSMGKSAFAVQCAVNAASDERVVAYFSLEDTNENTVARIISSQARINLRSYRRARMPEMMFDRALETRRFFEHKELYLVDTPRITPMQLFAKARRIHAERKRLDLIVVDYLQMMSGSTKTESRQQEVSQISRELKQVARELDVPLIALSQLSRECEKRNPPKPIMSDLRESGSLEQDADTVAFIFREEYYKQTEENRGIAEFVVGKQRNGPTGTIKAAFLDQFVRFENFFDDSEEWRQPTL